MHFPFTQKKKYKNDLLVLTIIHLLSVIGGSWSSEFVRLEFLFKIFLNPLFSLYGYNFL